MKRTFSSICLLTCCFLYFSFVGYAQGSADSTQNEQLQEIQVSGTKSEFRIEGGKKIYEVNNSITAQGGTALNIIRNVPTLDVDVNGNVLLRGKSPTIFVDGNPSDLTLEQIPASDIERVEIITMPSAKYQASASNGILNIVMKDKIKTGVNGMVMAGIDRFLGCRAGGNITYGLPKWEFGLRGFFRREKNNITQSTIRQSTNPSNQIVNYDNVGQSLGNRNFNFFSPSVKYKFTPKTSLKLSARYFFGTFDFEDNSDITSDSIGYAPTTVTARQKGYAKNTADIVFQGYNLDFDQRMKQKGSSWKARLRIQQADVNRPTIFKTTYLGGLNKEESNSNINIGFNFSTRASTDFTLQLTKDKKLEFGGLFSYRRIEFETEVYKNKQLDTNNSTAYTNTDIQGAIYATYAHKIGKLNYQAGIRVESSMFSADIANTNTKYDISFPFLVFPSVALQYEFNQVSSLQLLYTYKLDRPNFFQTTPLKTYVNQLNIRQGNPNLKPSFIHLTELNYNIRLPQLKGSNLLFTLYYKHAVDLITTYFVSELNEQGEEEIINTPFNAGTLSNFGLEITSRLVLSNWYNVTPNINILYADIQLNDATSDAQTVNGLSAFFKINQNFQLPKNWRIQWTAKYNTRSLVPPNSSGNGGNRFRPEQNLTAQGYLDGIFEMGIGVEKNWNDKLFVSLNLDDVLGTNTRRQIIDIDGFYQNNASLENPYFLSLNVRYIFSTLKKKPNMQPRTSKPKNQQESDSMF